MKSVATSFSTVVFSSLMAISLSACGPRHNNRARNENFKEQNKNDTLVVINVGQRIIPASPLV